MAYHWEWVESNLRVKCSEHGRHVAQILGIAWSGVYHICSSWKKSDFSDETCIVVNVEVPQLSTHDFNRLTNLVILCHDACIRLAVIQHTFRSLQLIFHRRDGREGDISRRHPTIEEAIERVRKYGGPKYEERENLQHATTAMLAPATSAVAQTGVPASA